MEALKEQDFLVSQIELKRKEMILSTTNTGFGSKQTLTLSRELDQLLNMHRKQFYSLN
jgi:hypothetical protein